MFSHIREVLKEWIETVLKRILREIDPIYIFKMNGRKNVESPVERIEIEFSSAMNVDNGIPSSTWFLIKLLLSNSTS